MACYLSLKTNRFYRSIVFVHGIQGHPEKTWLHDGRPKQPTTSSTSWRTLLRFRRHRSQSRSSVGESTQQAVYWPRDLLPRDCPNARIIAFGYDSWVTRGYVAADKGSIFSHAKDLLYALDRIRERGRRLMFVAHSLGGIIVKEVRVSILAHELPVRSYGSKLIWSNEKVLRRSELSSEVGIRDIIQSTEAVVFLGTPHRGSPGFASTADVVRRVAQAVLRVDSNSTIMRSLGIDGPELELCRETFVTQWQRHQFTVKTFQEAKGLTGVNLGSLNEKVYFFKTRKQMHCI
jgi:hypothetical protein